MRTARPSADARPTDDADLVLVRGVVRSLDKRSHCYEALACRRGQIIELGDSRSILDRCGPATRVIDLEGRAVVPGLVDAHAHMDREGLKGILPSLAGARSASDVVARISDLVRSRAPGEWIVTMPLGEPPNYDDPAAVLGGRLPDRWDLDAVSPDNPVYIRAKWGHWGEGGNLVSVANSRALRLAGIDEATEPPWSGITIERRWDGQPTGRFWERTFIPLVEHTLMRCAPTFSAQDRRQGLVESMRIYNSLGTTAVFEGHGLSAEVLDAYRSVVRSGRASVRADVLLSPSWGLDDQGPADRVGAVRERLAGEGVGNEWLRTCGVFLDDGRPEEYGLRAQAMPRTGWAGFAQDDGLPVEQVDAFLLEAARRRLRVGMIASPALLDILDGVHAKVPLNGLRWVLAHVRVLSPRDVARIRSMGLVVTTHTSAYIEKRGIESREALGEAREDWIVPLRSLLTAGVPVAFGSDNMPPSLFRSVWHAVARQSGPERTRIAPGECLSREEALKVASGGGAYVCASEQRRGTLETGKLADLAVLDADPMTVELDALKDIRAVLTVVDGNVVYYDQDSISG